MAQILTERDQIFINFYLETAGNGPRAAILIGANPRSASKAAAKILARPEVVAEIQRRTEELTAASQISVATLIREAEESRAVAQAAGNSAGMSQAISLKARLSGFLSDRPQPEEKSSVVIVFTPDDAKLL